MENNLTSLNKCVKHISNGWLTGLTIFTLGIITVPYLKSFFDLSFFHTKKKYAIAIKQNCNNLNLIELINYRDKLIHHDKLITFYWKYANIIFVTSITGITIFAYRNIIKKN